MGRNKSFNEKAILSICAVTFTTYGYEGTSIDQLVSSTGLLRGSIYGTFGSKRGLFIATLKEAYLHVVVSPITLDLSLIALLELAPNDNEVKALVETFLGQVTEDGGARILGERLLHRAAIITNK